VIGSSAESKPGRGVSLIMLALVLACATAILWFALRDDATPVAILPGCVPSAEAAAPSPREPAAMNVAVAPTTEMNTAVQPIGETTASQPAPPTTPNTRGTRVEGIVVDARTREPVPDLAVELRSGDVSDRVTTADDGSFRSTQDFPDGTLSAMLYDAGKNVCRHEREHRAGALELGWLLDAPIGPTYPIRISGAISSEASGWTARIVESLRDPSSAGEIDVARGELKLAGGLEQQPDRAWSWLALREGRNGSAPWIRYPTIEFAPDAAYPVRLELRHDDPALDAEAMVRSTVGIHPELFVRATASLLSARLEGEIRVVGGTSLPDVQLLLLPASADTGVVMRSNTWDEARLETSGRFEFARVSPGDKLLVAFAPNYVPAQQSLHLVRGMNRAPIIHLVRAVQSSVEVSLRAAPAEKSLVAVQLRLAGIGNAARAWLSLGESAQYGDWSCSFRDLPAGLFEMRQIGLRSRALGKPYAATVLAPRDLSIADVDPAQMKEVRFDVRLRGSSRGGGMMLSFGPGGSVFDAAMYRRDRRMWLPAGAPLEWAAWHPGYAPQFGTSSDFKDVDGSLVASVDLAPGWGAEIFFRAGKPSGIAPKSAGGFDARSVIGAVGCELFTAPPIADVGVIADREKAAESDAEGAVRLSLPKMPRRLSLRCPGWHLTRLQFLPLKQGVAVESYLAWMERDGS
jgi:hypothetical protein